MIPRYQTVLFALLLGASVAMGAFLWHLRDRAHQRLLSAQETTPTKAPEVAPMEQATLFVASDQEDTLQERILSLPLPASSSERARAILGKLMDLYADPASSHQVTGGAASIAEVFLLPASNTSVKHQPAHEPETTVPQMPPPKRPSEPQSDSELAVVNLTSSFAAGHPVGIETENLTILSICATLHANLPRVSEVRFLVDGQARATLAGHADLTRTYLTAKETPQP